MITIAEYIAWRCPSVYKVLVNLAVIPGPKKKTEKLTFKQWKRLMEERPLPGRAGMTG